MTTETPNLETLRPLLGELERYAVWASEGDHAFAIGSIGRVLITVQPKGPRKSMLGHFAQKRWSTKEGEAVHEIALAAEELWSPTIEVLGTLHHELVHAYCHDNGVKDCSKSGRHNKKFAEAGEGVGLVVETRSPSKGWAQTKMTEPLIKAVETEFKPHEEAFRLFRTLPHPKEPTPGKMKKWSCECDPPINVRAAVELDAECRVCEGRFVKEVV